MNGKQFFDLVAALREKQKLYFRTRTKESVNESKALERQLDAEIDRVNRILKQKKADYDTKGNN